MKIKKFIGTCLPIKTYRVCNEFDRDNSEIQAWIGESQAKSTLSPIIVEELDIRTENGKLAPARFSVRILDWKGAITPDPIGKSELYRLLHYYIRYVAVGARQYSIAKGHLK